MLLAQLKLELDHLDMRIDEADELISTHRNVIVVALANKLACMAWAVLAKNEPYRPPVLADVAAA